MSKRFLRKFKARFSNSDISSLHVTPDWTKPTLTGMASRALQPVYSKNSKATTRIFFAAGPQSTRNLSSSCSERNRFRPRSAPK